MKLAVAQLRSVAGDIDYNVRRHEALLSLAASQNTDLIIFPELSLTNYEPRLARGLVMSETDPRLESLQAVSERHNMVIGVGVPTAAGSGVRISMFYLQPGKEATTYSKQHLHEDEFPYFVPGTEHLVLSHEGEKLVPAICYESLLPEHAEQAAMLNASVYLASVAKPEGGVERGAKHYPMIARQHSMILLMANAVGQCDTFESVGRSAIWKRDGSLAGEMDDCSEGVLIFDTEREEVVELLLAS